MNKEELEDKIEYSKKYLENRYNHTGDYDLKYSLKTIIDLQQENKQLKKLITTILNWNIFNGECPMNFGYDKNTVEDKAQEIFCQDDDYCENNCNEDYGKCWLKYFNKMQELEKGE